MDTVMSMAKTAGYKKMILWTASSLTSAIRQYEKAGFKCVEEVENNTWATDGSTLYEIKMETDII